MSRRTTDAEHGDVRERTCGLHDSISPATSNRWRLFRLVNSFNH